MKSKVVFGDEKLKKEFEELCNSNPKLHKQLVRAFQNLEADCFCGIQIPKRLIPEDYERRFGPLSNLWKYNLPDAWRLIYTVKNDKINLLSIVLEWMDHKDYERRFRY